MKVLVGFSKGWKDNEPYKMRIVDTDYLEQRSSTSDEWQDIDLNKLNECVNIEVDGNRFKSNIQNPREYVTASFDVERLIGLGMRQENFQITDVYYDENNTPQLFRTVNSSGYISMHDISELKYKSSASIFGKSIEELPEFVKKHPLVDAYEWWKLKDEVGKNLKTDGFPEDLKLMRICL